LCFFLGKPLTLRNTASGLESQKGITEFINKVRNTPEGESIQLGVIRTTSSSTTPPADPFGNLPIKSKKLQKQKQQQLYSPTKETILLTPQKLRADDNSSPRTIGVMLGPNYVSTERIRTNNLPNAIQLASHEVTNLVKDTITSFADAASTVLSAPFKRVAGDTTATDDISSSGISGPIGVLKIGTDMVRTGDVNAVIFFAAAISINLAVFNSLPLPALDGGQIAFVLGEALSGKKIDQRLQEEINAIALLVLLLTSFSTVLIDL
jgi:membrane-associated protease RseP (regulator of RpoE activity)